jgi:hypothetical protein
MAGVRAAFAAAEQSAVLKAVKAWPPIGAQSADAGSRGHGD